MSDQKGISQAYNLLHLRASILSASSAVASAFGPELLLLVDTQPIKLHK